MMRPLFYPFFAIILLAAACRKDNAKLSTTLIGKWKHVGDMVSIGGPMGYVARPNATDFAFFQTDGTVGGTSFPDYQKYIHNDSVTVQLSSTIDKTKYENYRYTIKHDTLTMYLVGPVICFEGCGIVFLKQ